MILTTGIWNDGTLSGSALSIASFNEILPGIGGFVITLATVFFALSTILGWAYYGEVCIGFLFNNSKKAITIYRYIYIYYLCLSALWEA